MASTFPNAAEPSSTVAAPARRDDRIRVGHLIHTMAYGGIETALLNWIAATDTDRFEVHLICFTNPGGTETPFVEAAAKRGIPVDFVRWNRRKPIWRASKELAALVRRYRLHIVHSHNTYANLVNLAAARRANYHTVNTLYVWADLGFVRNVLQWADRITMPFFDQVTVHCQVTFDGTVARGMRPENLRLLPCGFEGQPAQLEPAERDRLRSELGATPDDLVLINIARMWPEKAHDVLLQGFKTIVERFPNAKLWLVGVGPEEENVRKMCDDLKLNSSVSFLGFRADLPELLALADVQVHPSDTEGVPLAICSGLAAGLPIVATEVGGLPEVIQDEVSGRLVPARRPDLFAAAVCELLADSDKRASLGAGGRRFIEDEYSLQAATRRVERVYEEVTAASRTEPPKSMAADARLTPADSSNGGTKR